MFVLKIVSLTSVGITLFLVSVAEIISKLTAFIGRSKLDNAIVGPLLRIDT